MGEMRKSGTAVSDAGTNAFSSLSAASRGRKCESAAAGREFKTDVFSMLMVITYVELKEQQIKNIINIK